MANRSRQRRLADLFIVGTPVEITGPRGESLLLWMQRLDPVDHDACVRKARAARARARAAYQDETSEEYLEARDVIDMTRRELLIEQIVAPEIEKIEQSATAELSLGEDSEWAKDDYLLGLYEEWATNISARYEEDPDDPDALRILAEFERHSVELNNAIAPQVADLRAQYEDMDIALLRDKAFEALVERRLGEAWLDEFVRSEVWLSAREACAACETEITEAKRRLEAGEPPEARENLHQEPHPKYYFADRVEVDRLEPTIRQHLESTYLQLSVDPTEGKDLPENGASSGSSDSSEAEGTAVSSGPAAAPA